MKYREDIVKPRGLATRETYTGGFPSETTKLKLPHSFLLTLEQWAHG